VRSPSFLNIRGARVHNLKNVSVSLPRNKLIVFTGVSGSGKSSLAFNTLYAEGQRRYVESLSAYARQFMARMDKPDVDYIEGLSPAIAIEQKTQSSNPRSTVGTVTEIFDYIKLLFARIGRTYSPVSGKEVKADSVTSIVDELMALPEDSKLFLYVKLTSTTNDQRRNLEVALQKGFTRVLVEENTIEIEELLTQNKLSIGKSFNLLIDRLIVRKDDEELISRLADSVQIALTEGEGTCFVKTPNLPEQSFSDRFEADEIKFERPSTQFFAFNNPYGACKTCQGFGRIIGIDEELVIPDKSKSIYDGAIAPWKGESMGNYLKEFLAEIRASKLDFPVHRPYFQLNATQKSIVWKGAPGVQGLQSFFKGLESQLHKIQYRVLLSRYRGFTQCPDCKGSRIRQDAEYVKIHGHSIGDWLLMPIDALNPILENLPLTDYERQIGGRLLREINARLNFLLQVGLGYLHLHRPSSTLSGGESQRIHLATSLGSSLVGALYILDEPSVGLHPRDANQLAGILEQLRDIGNTVIVVEHDEMIMERADFIVDMGPGAGEQGGEVVFQGNFQELKKSTKSLTAKYLTGKEQIKIPSKRRKFAKKITISGAAAHNLKGINVDFPLGVLTVVTGVSGSGKTTLIKDILYPALQSYIQPGSGKPGSYSGISGDIEHIQHVEMVDQSPIGRNARSNPVTYIKAYDAIRELYSNQPAAKVQGLKPAHFSFNVEGGRCEACQGEGHITVQMQFMSDVVLPCETCNSQRFKEHVLEVQYQQKNIFDILNMTLTEALAFFANEPKVINRLKYLEAVGLGYIRLGQSSSTLSGGEAQRIKLAAFLADSAKSGNTLYIFDEPTTGLHLDDIKKLLNSIQHLIEAGNSVILIEHHLDVIKCADWIIDLGPEGGVGGGELVFEGTPEDLLNNPYSYTAQFLKDKLA
jgi:excinuclease ABC subunit A